MIKYIKFWLVLNTSHSIYIEMSMRIKMPKIINFLVPSKTVICTHGDGDIMFWLTLVLCMSDGYEISCVDIWYITRIEARVVFFKACHLFKKQRWCFIFRINNQGYSYNFSWFYFSFYIFLYHSLCNTLLLIMNQSADTCVLVQSCIVWPLRRYRDN